MLNIIESEHILTNVEYKETTLSSTSPSTSKKLKK